MFPDIWAKLAREGISVVRQKNVLRPLLALDAVIALPCFAAAVFGHFWQGAFFVAPWPLIVFTLGYYAFFAHTDPDRLQDEEFQQNVREQKLSLERKGGEIISDPIQLEVVSTPSLQPAQDADNMGTPRAGKS